MWSEWLDPAASGETVVGRLPATTARDVTAWPVGPDVGDVANNGMHLTERVDVIEPATLF
jgi:putative SOS response-associated peptidase YedK